jgi:hypothetical protein
MKIILKCIVLLYLFTHLEAHPLKALHLTFHRGCLKEIEQVARELDLDLKTWFIPDLPPYFFDPVSQGNMLYNIGHDRANRIWEKHKDYFEQFDVVITSDTAPLSRIFLQNGFTKFLIVWVCNRFDYYDGSSLDCKFPDPEYYQLFRNGISQANVRMVAYTPFESFYAQIKKVDMGGFVIKPSIGTSTMQGVSPIPTDIVKEETFFLPPYHNETIFMNLSNHCNALGIKNYCGHYNGALDLKDFKGIIHIPYAWSNFALFENLKLGIPYFIPSKKFMKKLLASGGYFQDAQFVGKQLELSEWYCPEHQNSFIYFDSWEDLKEKTEKIDLALFKQQIQTSAQQHYKKSLDSWRNIFSDADNWTQSSTSDSKR